MIARGLLTVFKKSGNVLAMKSFLEKIWAIDSSKLVSSNVDDILNSLSVEVDNDEISLAMQDIVQLMSSLSVNDEGGIFANGKFIQKDHVI